MSESKVDAELENYIKYLHGNIKINGTWERTARLKTLQNIGLDRKGFKKWLQSNVSILTKNQNEVTMMAHRALRLLTEIRNGTLKNQNLNPIKIPTTIRPNVTRFAKYLHDKKREGITNPFGKVPFSY